MTRPPSGAARPPREVSPPRDARPALLATLLDSARRAAARAARAGPVDREVWREVAGDRIASRTEIGQLEQGTLEIRVDSPVWAQELAFLARDIVQRLRARGLPVNRIRFRVAAVAPLDVRPRRERRVAPVALPGALTADLARVQDPELRAVIATAARYSLGLHAAAVTGSRAARAPRSAAPGSDPPAPSDPASHGAPRRRA